MPEGMLLAPGSELPGYKWKECPTDLYLSDSVACYESDVAQATFLFS